MLAIPFSPGPKTQSGFTLIEIIVGIVVLAIALVVITGALGPLYKRSADPWHQVRAAELGHSLLNEIMARSFDENSDRAGSEFRCNADPTEEPGAAPCSDEFGVAIEPLACALQTQQLYADCGNSSCWGADSGEFDTNGLGIRIRFDDVDDFHGFVGSGSRLLNILGSDLAVSYANYKVCIDVRYAGDELGADEEAVKRITVNVVTPSGEQIDFAAYRSNW